MLPKRHTIDGFRLMDKWNVDLPNLSYLILKHDISVLEPNIIPTLKFFFRPKDFKIDTAPLLNLIHNKPNSLYGKLFWLPEIEKIENENDISAIKSKASSESLEKPYTPRGLYRRPNDDKSSATEPSSNADKEKANDQLKNVIEEHDGYIKQHSNVFSLIGKVWFIKFKQKEWGLYPDQEKYKYIAHLLSQATNSCEEKDLEFTIYNTELIAKVKGKEIVEENQYGDERGGLNRSDFNDKITTKDFRSFKNIGYELLDKLNEAEKSGSQKAIDEAQTNIEKYRYHLSNEYGIFPSISKHGGKISFKKYYRSSRENEKLRNLIKNQIRNAITDFNDQMPMLKMHLKRSIFPKTMKTIYNPETHFSWHVSM